MPPLDDAAADAAALRVASDVASQFARHHRTPTGWPGHRSACWPAAWAQQVASRLLPGATPGSPAPFAPTLIRLEGSGRLTLQVLPGAVIKARMRGGDGALHSIVITEGLAQAVMELTASLWMNAAVMPELGPVDGFPCGPDEHEIPIGLDFAYRSPPEVADPAVDALHDHAPVWLQLGLACLAGPRRYAFECTLREALRFVWLHELGHALGRHLDLLQVGAPELDGVDNLDEIDGVTPRRRQRVARSVATEEIDEALIRALEVEADRFAMDRLLARALLRARSPQAVADEATELRFSMLAGLVVMTVFHARRHLSARPAALRRHPPPWFRAGDIVQATSALRARQLREDGADEPETRRARLVADDMADRRLVHELCAVHPFFAEWLGPAIGEEHAAMREAFLAEARSTLALRVPDGRRPAPLAPRA